MKEPRRHSRPLSAAACWTSCTQRLRRGLRRYSPATRIRHRLGPATCSGCSGALARGRPEVATAARARARRGLRDA
jgi:hypothetical protein